MNTKETFLTIDPPSGWKYGFPKAVTQEQYKEIKNLKQWCIDNGYPKEEAHSYGNYFHIQINGDLSFINEDKSTRKQYSQEEVDELLDRQAAEATHQTIKAMKALNQKQFKTFDESLFKSYIDKMPESESLNMIKIIYETKLPDCKFKEHLNKWFKL